MCEVNWLTLLEYLKVLLSWPPMGLLIAILFITKFRSAIDNFLQRLVEGNIFGQQFKAAPPREQQRETPGISEDRLSLAAEAQAVAAKHTPIKVDDELPPELANDPQAQGALSYVKANPAKTVVEYKRLYFQFSSERLFNLIYGTQVALLVYLESHPEQTFTLSQLARFHDAHQSAAGRTDYQLRDYITFLVNFGVIAVSGPAEESQYRITQAGVEFLSYIKATYAATWSQRPL